MFISCLLNVAREDPTPVNLTLQPQYCSAVPQVTLLFTSSQQLLQNFPSLLELSVHATFTLYSQHLLFHLKAIINSCFEIYRFDSILINLFFLSGIGEEISLPVITISSVLALNPNYSYLL